MERKDAECCLSWLGGGARKARRIALALALSGALGTPLWAAEADDRRGSVPPGASVDGAPPIGGAIVGGSIQRNDKADTPKELERCRDLTGTLQAQCLRDARMREPQPMLVAPESEPVNAQR
jgi:hypothetical protein